MIDRRFGPLVVLLALGLLCVLVRAAQIQIKEHLIWAQEAANLDRSSRRLPYHRGRILARGGEVLVEDEGRYRVSFEWREFRRENIIGQVALASSVDTGEPVRLISDSDDPDELVRRAKALIKRSLGELKDDRAADMAFYLRRIVALEERADGRLRQLMAEPNEGSRVLSLAAQACREVRADLREVEAIKEINEHVTERCRSALYDLDQLEIFLELERGSLMVAMERCREEVDDAVASQMFRRAAGFSAGRLEPDVLAALDLEWLRESLRWEDEREAVWRARVRSAWKRDMLTRVAPRAALEARTRGPESTFDRLLQILASTFTPIEGAQSTALEPWSSDFFGSAAPELFDLEQEPAGSVEEPFFVAVQTHEISEAWSPTWELFADSPTLLEKGDWAKAWSEAGLEGWEPPRDAAEAHMRWQGAGPTEVRRLAQWLVVLWSLEWQRGWSRYLEPIATEGDIALSAERVKSALEDRDYFRVEQGRRARPIEEAPSYEAVYLLTRYPERFRGFHVETRTRRTKDEGLLGGQDPLWRVIGDVRKMNLEESLIHEDGIDKFKEVRREISREDDVKDKLRQLVGSLLRHDEQHGADGVEFLMDERLSGSNGYVEYEGLSELVRRKGKLAVEVSVQHGEDVRLTIDLDLQRAASETINRPIPKDDPKFDKAWFDRPTGAICLMTPGGEVLAAASAPNRPRERPIAFRGDQGKFANERTLRRYTAQPIGSVFKPFVALWCLEHELVTAEEMLTCLDRTRRGVSVAGYRSVDCHKSAGHDHLNLAEALRVSCNAYFAQLGGRLGSAEVLIECARTFGFDRSTGVNDLLPGEPIPEDYENPFFRQKSSQIGRSELELGANGLMVLEGTPMQVARAFAGLATGRLPNLTFVSGSGTAAPEPLPISTRHLEAVRSALREVAQTGSANHLRGLDVAAKTGSADYKVMTPQIRAQLVFPAGSKPSMRKHTWVAGWTPANDPRLIFVVYLHDIGVTSTHSSVYVARQLLERPEVRAYLGR